MNLWLNRTQRRRYWQNQASFGTWAAAAATTFFVLVILVLALWAAQKTNPGFGSVPYLVDLLAEGTVLSSAVFVALAAAGYSLLGMLRLVENALREVMRWAGRIRRVPPTHILLPTEELLRPLQCAKTTAGQLQARLQTRPPLLARHAKTPFLLFQQAPLLVAP